MEWKDFFLNLGQNAVQNAAGSVLGIGTQALGNLIFNKQQEHSSERLMQKQAQLQREQAFLAPTIDRLGKMSAGISPSFDGETMSISTPSVPMPSTGTDVKGSFDPFMSAQLESLQLQNERQRIENARMREEDKTSRSAYGNLAADLGLEWLLNDDVPDGYYRAKDAKLGWIYRNDTGKIIKLDEVRKTAPKDSNFGSWTALERVANTLMDIKRKGIENDIAGFHKFLNDLQMKDDEVVKSLVKMPENSFRKLDEEIKTEAKKRGLLDAQTGQAKAQADYTNFIKDLEENTNVKNLVDDLLPRKEDDNIFERALRILAYFLLARKFH